MSIEIVRRPTVSPLPEWALGLHPVLARVYAARRVRSANELEHGLSHLLPPHLLKGIDTAVQLLHSALEKNDRILVIGDFDADGATSTAVAVRALRLMGAREVDFLVPNRFEFGYGLTPEIVAVARERRPDLIITVDNGISSVDGVAAAKAAGIRVLVTDHHLAGQSLPAADAIVNPNQPGDTFPSKALAGVGVIFYVMLALRAHLREAGWFAARCTGTYECRGRHDSRDGGGRAKQDAGAEEAGSGRGVAEPNLAQLLDLVALGTVADVVPLDHNNRILVAQGLARIRQGHARPGLTALCRIAGRDPARLGAADLGFALGPRLNAAGRLTDMSLGITCLLAENDAQARELAQRLDELNRERRRIEDDMRRQAEEVVDDMRLGADADLPSGLCLFHPEWHQGVIGILASRIKERVHRPVIAFAPAGEDDLKGSARSVSGLHIRDALDAIAASHPGLLTKFGGHAMAAGLSLPRAHFAAFAAAFDQEVRRHLSPEDLRGVIYSDGELQPADVALELAELVSGAGPWGQEFPEPVFDGVFEVAQQRIVGEKHLKLVLRWPATECRVDAIAFNAADTASFGNGARVHAAYRITANEYQGKRSLQLHVEHLAVV